MGKRGGTVCAVKTCSNKTSNKSVKWHRFPKDIARARIWITACDREDLHHKSADELYNNYRVCSLHFEANMYANLLDLLNRLLPTAVPTIFPGMESSSGCKRKATEDECTSVTKIHKLSDSRTIPENTCIGVAVENVEMSSKICSAIVDPSSVTLSETCVPVYEPLCVNVDDCEESIPPALTSPVSTQTPISLTAHTPRKEKLRQTVTELRKEKEELRRENIMTTVEQSEENLEHFMRLCNNFLPESMISLIQLQAQLHDKKPKGRRYPNEYKEFALSLYFLGPRAYKFLSTIMYLPTIRSLHRMTEAVLVQAGLDVIESFNKLFDMLNSSVKKGTTPYHSAFTGDEFQLDFLFSMSNFIRGIKIISDKGSDLTNNMRFLNCWLVTIKSTQLLWSQLQEVGYQCLMTRRVNTDCLENFFGCIRQQGGNCVNPTPIQFERSFRKLFCQNYFHTGSTNCADDSAVILSSLSKASTFKVSDDITPQTTLSFDFADCDYRNEETLNQNSFTYVCGYLVKKLLSVHNCTVCHQQLTQCLTLDNHTTLTYLKASSHSPPGQGGLNLPSESFLNFIYKLEKIFFSHFEEFALQTGIRNKYYNIMTVIPFQCDCSEFPMDYVIKLFIRLRIFYALKFTNRELITCKNKKNLKLMILSHL